MNCIHGNVTRQRDDDSSRVNFSLENKTKVVNLAKGAQSKPDWPDVGSIIVHWKHK